MGIKLTARLEKIAGQVPIGDRVADIGTDHGYIPIYLLKNKISPLVIAGDINKKPLQSARDNIAANNLGTKIETRLGNGLAVLRPGEVDTIIIAGMGGLQISQLLDNSREIVENIKTLIVQPMQAQTELRKYLVAKDFTIKEDLLVKEGRHIYEIIVAKPGRQEVTDEIYYEIGFHLARNPRALAQEFINRKIRTTRKIIENIRERSTGLREERLEELKNRLKRLEEVLLCLQE